MTVLRTDIERALDELISNEEGMRFQGLAVVLAKQRWRHLIACERKWDRGLDAYMPASLAQDGVAKGLASSLSATLEKLKRDAQKVHEHFRDVRVLIFTTPVSVTNHTANTWAEAIKNPHNLELVVISREDIISELMLPSNASICRSHLALPVSVEDGFEELLARAQQAAVEAIASWSAHSRIAGRPRLGLRASRLSDDGGDTGELLSVDTLHAALLQGRRIVLEAPAGRGKTTTLVQLAEGPDSQGLPLLIDLPAWITSGADVLEFVARSRPFASRSITTQELARLYGVAHFRFLLNGWNEVSDSYSERAQGALANLERNFPTAGIIVATRNHYIRPPLPGSFRARLLPLTRSQRVEYLQQTLANRAGELGGLLDRERLLDDLTRTPLFLAEVVSLFLSGEPIPKTKLRVLDAVVRLAEQGDQHRGRLARSPLSGRSRDYLAQLAVQMTAEGAVAIQEMNARSVVHSVSLTLSTGGQLAALPEPAAILSALTAHHVLERLEYPSAQFKFEHQQFQEFFVATELARQLYAVDREGEPETNRRYARDYVNRPLWEEPLRMIAEEIGSRSGTSPDLSEAVAAGARLVEMALLVDPVFAADLSQLCGPLVWRTIRGPVGERLRAWYQVSDQHFRECALGAMLASGSDDFLDLLLPLLSADDQQVRLRTYRAWGEFHLTTLGPDWRRVVGGWGDEQRCDFVTQAVREGGSADIAEDFARTDQSAAVRNEALRALEWVGASETLSRVLAELDDGAFEQLLQNRVLDRIPPAMTQRALDAYERLLLSAADPAARLEFRIAAAALGATNVLSGVKEALSSWPAGRIDSASEALLRSALEALRPTDPTWVSQWVAERISDGTLWPDLWITLVLSIPEALREALFVKLCAEDLRHDDRRVISVLAKVADAGLISRAFTELCRMRTVPANATEEEKQRRWAAVMQLHDLIRAVSPNLAVVGTLAGLSITINAVEYETVTELFGRVNLEDSGLRGQLDEDLRQRLRRYLKGGLSLTLARDDFGGQLKAEAATALAQVGEPTDLSDLERLVLADIERVRRGRAARLGHQRSAMANGAVMTWTTWYVWAMVRLDPQHAEGILLALLSEAEYEQDAARALVQVARSQTGTRWVAADCWDYSVVSNLREGFQQTTGFDDVRRVRYTAAIKRQIAMIMETRSQSAHPDSSNGRLKGLAKTIAVLDGPESADSVMDILALPGEWDDATRVDALQTLLSSGARLNAEAALRVLDPTINRNRFRALNDQGAAFLLRRCLSLLPFVQPCSVGIARIREVVVGTRFAPYELREIIPALGQSRCAEALDFLVELATTTAGEFDAFGTEWIDAIAAFNSADSRRILLSFVDPDLGAPPVEHPREYYHRERLVSHIVGIAQLDPTVRDRLQFLATRELPPMMRTMLTEVFAGFGTGEAVIAALGLIHDRSNPSVPYGLLRGLEAVILERRPYGGSDDVYTLEPRSADEIRSRLFAMVSNDDSRKRSAWALLGRIESWRLEYGRPASEPRHPAFDSGTPWPPGEPA
jgi:hypothetical protein